MSETVPLFPLIRAILLSTYQFFPWQSLEQNDFLIYKKSTENIYLENLEKTKSLTVRDLEEKNYAGLSLIKNFINY